jgi:hypothetical protein
MKNKLLIVAFLALSVSLATCDKVLTFDISDETTVTIEKALTPFSIPYDFPTPDITTNSEQEFENNDTKVELVKEIILKDLDLTITSPTDKTFSFLKSIHIYIDNDTEEETELAWKDDIQSDAKTIQLNLTTNTLDNYVKSSKYKLRTEVVTRETLNQDVDIKISMTFQVTADPF